MEEGEEEGEVLLLHWKEVGGELSNHQREMEAVEVQLLQGEDEEEGGHDAEISDYGMQLRVEVGQGREEGLDLETEGLRRHHLVLGGYFEMEDPLHLCGQ